MKSLKKLAFTTVSCNQRVIGEIEMAVRLVVIALLWAVPVVVPQLVAAREKPAVLVYGGLQPEFAQYLVANGFEVDTGEATG